MKWVLLKSISEEVTVVNVIVPGDSGYQSLLESDGFTVRGEDDNIPVAPGWKFNAELEAYYE